LLRGGYGGRGAPALSVERRIAESPPLTPAPSSQEAGNQPVSLGVNGVWPPTHERHARIIARFVCLCRRHRGRSCFARTQAQESYAQLAHAPFWRALSVRFLKKELPRFL
jgi:hypothetical protein